MLTEEEMTQLTEQLSEVLMGKVNIALNGYDKKLKLKLESLSQGVEPKDEESPTTKPVTGNPEVLAIQKQLDLMKAELAEKTKAAHTSSLKGELTSLLAGTISPSAVSELILNRVSDKFTQSGDTWLDTEGSDLKSYVDTYLASGEGQVFVKPTVTNTGNNPTPKPGTPNPNSSKDKTESLINSLLM